MPRRPLRTVAWTLGLAAGAATFACVALLVVMHFESVRELSEGAEQLDAMTRAAKVDLAKVPALHAEFERRTEASLEQEAAVDRVVRVLLIAAAVFLASAKTLTALRERGSPTLEEIARRGGGAFAGSHGRRRRRRKPRGEGRGAPAGPPVVDLAFVDATIDRIGTGKEAVLPILQAIQEHERYLDPAALTRVCDRTEITPAQITGVASYYTRFHHEPIGEHVIQTCHGTACHVAGAPRITEELRRHLDLAPGSHTDADRRFSVENVACLGCCTLAPVVQIGESTYGHLLADAVPEVLDDFLDSRTNGKARRAPVAGERSSGRPVARGEIRVGLDSCCVAAGSAKVHAALEEAVASTGGGVTVRHVGCQGMCHRTPLVEVVVPGEAPTLYSAVKPDDARTIVSRHFKPESLARRLGVAATDTARRWRGGANAERSPLLATDHRDPGIAAFLERQRPIATEHCSTCDPLDLDDYVHRGGFDALRRCLHDRTPDAIITEIERSGLRGRGGAGYPSAAKWAKVRAAESSVKYLVVNGDEGDPGAFMDRMLMESVPFRVIEGAAIAARAVGACAGYLYIRAEYPLAVQRVTEALRRCEERGYLGDDVLGSGVAFRLEIMEGGGAFVCGEETALLASIEGERGSPRIRPPFPTESGLWEKPTLVNNVETLATVPWIIREGAAAFAALGTPTSRGTKVFSLAGKVKRGGLIEVPMGMTLHEIVFGIGGGMRDGRRLKAVQIGGPSGGCVPAALADTPVDYEALAAVGAIMGSGGLVVLDDTDCMVDIARYFLAFTQNESCGKCTFCRIGTRRMLEILERICAGKGRRGDLVLLEQTAAQVGHGSLCGLGKTAPNPVLATLEHFRDEYEAHLEGRCPAGQCKNLIHYRVTDRCVGCTLCAQRCPVDAIPFTPYRRHEIDSETCTRCDTCRARCPEEAIEVI